MMVMMLTKEEEEENKVSSIDNLKSTKEIKNKRSED